MKFLLPLTLLLCSFQTQKIQGQNKHQSFTKITLHSLESKGVYLEIVKDQREFAFWICKEKGLFGKIANNVPVFVSTSSKRFIFLPLLMKGNQKLKITHEDASKLLNLEDRTLTLSCDGYTFHLDKKRLKKIRSHYRRFFLPTFDIEMPGH